MIRFFWTVALAVCCQYVFPQGKIERMEPSCWWSGMAYHQIEVLVHHPGIGAFKPSVKIPGVKQIKTIKLPNPNYLIIDLDITKSAKPGKYTIQFTNGAKSLSADFEVKSREHSDKIHQGVSDADLIYMVFPDRFANGDTTNDIIKGTTEPVVDRKGLKSRHGGDIKGIIQHLDYIQEIGTTALWVNPVFENNQPYESYHGYAITDHYRVDPRLGNMNDYQQLVQETHRKGMRVIKDVVYNHIGNEHYLFKDLPDSSWFHWWKEGFVRTTYRDNTLFDPYASQADRNLMSNGWFDKHMPDLDQKNKHVAKFLIQNAIWWIELTGLDAYRIDTYAYPDQEFMSNLCNTLLNEYPKFSIFGETWVQGVHNQAFFSQNYVSNFPVHSSLPAITDFQWAFAAQEALTKDQGWTEGVMRLYATLSMDGIYKNPNKHVIFLDNHDISRIYSVLGEDYKKFRQAIVLLLSMRGIPCIYYGTEILMKNYADPDAKVREDFPGGWPGDKQNKFVASGRSEKENEAFDLVKNLALYRKNTLALHSGKLVQFVPVDGVYTYFRYDSQKTIMVVLNTSGKSKSVELSRFAERSKGFSNMKDILSGKPNGINPASGKLELEAHGVGIYELVK